VQSRAAELKPLGPGCFGLDFLAGVWLGKRKVSSLALLDVYLLWWGSRFPVRR
jgi:hypothetical protein